MTKKSFLMIAVATLGLTAATMAQNVPNYVPTNGLVGWWPFNGNANDESGNGNNGTVNGAIPANDRFGINNKAYSTSSGYITCINNNIPVNSTFSISIWFKCYVDFGIGEVVNLSSPSSSNWGSVIGNNYFTMNYGRGCGSTFSTPAAIALTDTNWHNVVFVSSGLNGSTNIYYDGLFSANTTNANHNGNCSTSNLCFGSDRYLGGGVNFNGKLDDIGLWNRALTPQEITDLYNGNICYQTITVTDTLLINMGITGFNPVAYNNTIKIFPNPTKDHITIDYGNISSLNGYQLKITNSLGQQMFQTAINQQSNYISLNSWTGNGLYFVHIIDPQGNTIDIRKIVLQ